MAILASAVVMTDAIAMDEKQAQNVARASVQDQGYPPEMEGRIIADTVKALTSFPSWAPLYPNAVLTAMGNEWEADAQGKTASGTLSFTTKDSRTKIADFYAKAFSAKGEVTQIRDEEPWTIEVITPDQSEVMTVNIQQDEPPVFSVTLRYNKAPVN